VAPVGNVAADLSPRSHTQASKKVDIHDQFSYDVAFRMAFLGTGQGGGRIADAFYRLGYRRVAAFNTTDNDFDGLAIDQLHSLETGGSAKDTKQAAAALRHREEEIVDLMMRSWGNELDCALICASLGGGTGSGTAPQLVQVARRYMEDRGLPPRVGALVSLPTVTEGYQVCRNAVTAFKQLMDMQVSPLIVIDNARIQQLYRPGITQLHAKANNTISSLLHLFNQLAAIHSQFITFDRSELAQLLDSGICVMGAASIDNINSPADVSKAIREELTNNVLAEVDLSRGKKAACLFVGSQDVLDSLDLSFFDAGYSQLDRTLGSAYDGKVETVVHRGLYLGGEPGLQAYTMISELDPPKERLAELAKKGGLINGGGMSSIGDYLGV
jgi:cell division GTPase FtsZ